MRVQNFSTAGQSILCPSDTLIKFSNWLNYTRMLEKICDKDLSVIVPKTNWNLTMEDLDILFIISSKCSHWERKKIQRTAVWIFLLLLLFIFDKCKLKIDVGL